MENASTESVVALDQCIAAEVRAEIARQKITQIALAARLGWNQAFLSRRLAGGNPVPFTAGELVTVAAALGVPFSSFIPLKSLAHST